MKYFLPALLFISHFSFAQNPLVKQWDYRFGGTDDDAFYCVQQTTDRGYILGGTSYSSIGGNKSQANWGNGDYWIVKIDSLGNYQWDKDFGGAGVDNLLSLMQTVDGGYILGGYSGSNISGNKTQSSWGAYDFWIVKTDSLGNYEWDRDFGGTESDALVNLQQTSDKGYILVGNTKSGISGNKSESNWGGNGDYWVVKIDSFGNYEWDRDLGGTWFDHGNAVQETPDGGFIVGGMSMSDVSGNKTQPPWGNGDYWIVKLDATGGIEWDKVFGGTNAEEYGSLQITNDSGCILLGYSRSGIDGNKSEPNWGGDGDYWMVKIDSLGNIEWDKDFGGTEGEHSGFISQTIDNGYLVTGSSYSPISGNKTENNLSGTDAIWIIKTDSIGNFQWDKTLQSELINRGKAIQSTDGCYIIAALTSSGIGGEKTQQNWDTSLQTFDYWIVKFCPEPPHTALMSNITSSCNGSGCFDFTDTSTHMPQSWQWLFPSATPSTSTDQNPTNICYNTPGTYDVTLITSNAYGSDTLTLTNYITVYAAPAPPVITQSNDTLTSSAAYSYQWYTSGSAIPAATNQLLIITQSGDYSVTITDSLGCSASDTIAAVLLYPQSAFNSGAISGCPGSCFDFTNASLNATTYQWFFTGGNPATSTQQNPSNVCYANPGAYDVTLIASTNFADDTLVQTGYITIFTPLAVSISQNGNFLTCNPAAASYQWSLNGYQIPGATSQTLFINQTGIFTIEVIDTNGCSSSAAINVSSVPSPNFAAADTTVCEKFCVNFTDQSSNNPTAWQWIFSGGDPAFSSEQNPANICYNVPGVYDVTLITTNANGNDTLTLQNYITVYSTPPFPSITQVGYTLTSSTATSYQWQFNSVDISGATNQSYDVMQTGFYTVIVGDSNGCKNSTTVYVLISGIDEVSDGSIFISPNPSNGNFTIELHNGPDLVGIADEVSIDVVNTLGQKVFSSTEKNSSPDFKKQIDLSNIARGVYFIEIKTENEFLRKKIVIAD